ncbi:hypothetical protein NDN08_004235 [Rhodosorus marinus]|uniref:Uncharacterized protein n=1 Tax=Rhodosorus marinus TaxID=101924 RepID=A0AAV8UHL3_9RHOD|nr:hypothetical protein NDN08_004235 [Rhodosorus marinus]
MTLSLLVMTVVGAMCLGNVETRVLWGESYCKELTLKELNGKTPKLCVRNENPVEQAPTSCLRLNLRHIDTPLIKELRVGIHPDCSSIPVNDREKFQRRRSKTKLASETCCETVQCLLFEAVVEVAGVDSLVTVDDGTCSAEEGCPYSIGCPNLINEGREVGAPFTPLLGTESNDLFILDENDKVNYVLSYKGYDVVIGSEGQDLINGYYFSQDGLTAFLKGGDDFVIAGEAQAKIYLGKGNDLVRSNGGPSGYQDFSTGSRV